MLNLHILAENLVSAFALNAEAAPDSKMESLTTGAVFALTRVLHQTGEFEAVVTLAASQLEMSPVELVQYLPYDEDAADFRELFESAAAEG